MKNYHHDTILYNKLKIVQTNGYIFNNIFYDISPFFVILYRIYYTFLKTINFLSTTIISYSHICINISYIASVNTYIFIESP